MTVNVLKTCSMKRHIIIGLHNGKLPRFPVKISIFN